MSKSSIILFSIRLLLYFSVIILIFIHPGVAVSFDRIGIIQWFIIIPAMIIIAFIPESHFKMRFKRIASLALILILSLVAGVSVFGAIQFLAAGFISFMLTSLLFNRPPLYAKFAKITILEPFFLAWVCLRLLSLSRSGEDIAGQSFALTQFILVWTAVVFLLHCVVIYLCLYPKSQAKILNEGLVFLFSVLAISFILVAVLPPDFVRNAIMNNLRSEKIPPIIKSSNDRGLPTRDGGRGRRTLPRNQNGRQQELRGLSEHEWPGRGGSGSDNRQYMVKIVASQKEPVYMGNIFRGKLDPAEGFIISTDEQLNNLAQQRFFITWSDSEHEYTIGREIQEVFSLSTLQQKYFPYRPVSIDPTILNEDSGPLRYIHQVVSNMHVNDPLMLIHAPSRPFSTFEKFILDQYLEITLDESDREMFSEWLNNALQDWKNNSEEIILNDRYLNDIFYGKYDYEFTGIKLPRNEYLDIIIALLVSFSKYQYNLNPDDDHSIEAIKNFLFNSAEGDCVEFSNTLALLGRLAGIPSRVVTGYIAAESLQTPAHLRGIEALQAQIPVLRQFAFSDLFMVTNLHSHSWTQFYIPDYGWLDFEATAFSLPPEGMGDFNNWDVVIPLLDENKTFSQIKKFPWRAVGRTSIILVIAAIVCAYALRYIRELVLYFNVRRGGRRGARSLYLLLLARLAADGQPIKPASKTAHEYSEQIAVSNRTNGSEQRAIGPMVRNKEQGIVDIMANTLHLKTFADIYSEIRWRQFNNPAEIDQRFKILCNEYDKILVLRKRGLHHVIKRIFSLRGLAYL